MINFMIHGLLPAILMPVNNYTMIHGLLRISCSRNPKTPQIRYFSVFCGSQVHKPYHASMNGFLNF